MLKNLKHSNLFLLTCLAANMALLPALAAHAPKNAKPTIRNDETEFVFAGHCTNGKSYRIVSHQMDIDGLMQSFYDYEGPAGKGTIRTNVSPQKMLTRLCRDLADIHDGSKFD